MEGRGRKSTASLTVVPAGLPSRLEPPKGMSEAQANLWRNVVDSKPSDWFTAADAPLLVEYVRAVDTANLLHAMIAAQFAGKGDLSLRDLLAMRDRESRRAKSLGTSLRITHQSRYTPQAAATADRKAGDGKKPWQFGSA